MEEFGSIFQLKLGFSFFSSQSDASLEEQAACGWGGMTPQEECHKGVGNKPVHDGGEVRVLGFPCAACLLDGLACLLA